MDTLKEAILNSDFIKAKELILNTKKEEIENKLIELAFELDDIGIYFLISDIASDKEEAFWHSMVSTILSTAFCHICGAYQVAFKHMTKAMQLEPKNIRYMEGILLFYSIPEKVLNFQQVKKIVKDILDINPDNETAKRIINSNHEK